MRAVGSCGMGLLEVLKNYSSNLEALKKKHGEDWEYHALIPYVTSWYTYRFVYRTARGFFTDTTEGQEILCLE